LKGLFSGTTKFSGEPTNLNKEKDERKNHAKYHWSKHPGKSEGPATEGKNNGDPDVADWGILEAPNSRRRMEVFLKCQDKKPKKEGATDDSTVDRVIARPRKWADNFNGALSIRGCNYRVYLYLYRLAGKGKSAKSCFG